MHIHYISEQNSIILHFLSQLRDVHIQKDSMRFRKNMERIGEIMAYELSKTLQYTPVEIKTPLGIKSTNKIKNDIVLCSILRAGLALHQGFMHYFDDAENGFVSASRTHGATDISVEYQAAPNFTQKTVLLLDPMLATGQSLVAVYDKILAKENPAEIHICVVIAAPEGIAFLEQHLPEHVHLWIATKDDGLNADKYIIPGIGDAGDLAFGEKL